MVEQLHQNDQAHATSVGGLVFEDDEHNTHTLQSLNKMRKNKHFCDVILHVRTSVGR
jgi:influenza virus NS1A-binding protein